MNRQTPLSYVWWKDASNIYNSFSVTFANATAAIAKLFTFLFLARDENKSFIPKENCEKSRFIWFSWMNQSTGNFSECEQVARLCLNDMSKAEIEHNSPNSKCLQTLLILLLLLFLDAVLPVVRYLCIFVFMCNCDFYFLVILFFKPCCAFNDLHTIFLSIRIKEMLKGTFLLERLTRYHKCNNCLVKWRRKSWKHYSS